MTTKKLTGILSLFLCIICLVSCNDNDDNFSPITLEYEDPQIKFDNESRSYTLTPFPPGSWVEKGSISSTAPVKISSRNPKIMICAGVTRSCLKDGTESPRSMHHAPVPF